MLIDPYEVKTKPLQKGSNILLGRKKESWTKNEFVRVFFFDILFFCSLQAPRSRRIEKRQSYTVN